MGGTHSCPTGNPDITGIGVRLSMYIQASVSIFLPIWARLWHKKSLSAEGNIINQFINAFALGVGLFVLRDKLGTFHRVATVRLQLLNVLVAYLIIIITSWHKIRDFGKSSFWFPFKPLKSWYQRCFLYLAVAIILSIIWTVLWAILLHNPDKKCDTLYIWLFQQPTHTGSSTGIFLLAISFGMPLMLFFVQTITYRIFTTSVQRNLPVKRTPWSIVISTVVFSAIMIAETIDGIERSLKANPKFIDPATENEWGFGQIIPMILLWSVASTLVKELWGIFRGREGYEEDPAEIEGDQQIPLRDW
ncbi:hypothetical protein DL96DRAFT_1789251 [Flagelloscypha sp. PMI_526]|nr:hypothetical protein DL96DRAFT_1789251 [Flagelloscypha sp. PMI_526]